MPSSGFSLEIDGKEFRYWSGLTLTRAIDSVDTVTFEAPFDPDIKEHRDLFRPAKYCETVIKHDGETIFTGTLLNPTPSCDPESSTVSVSAYSKCGVLEDCCMPHGSLSELEFNGFSLDKIAKAVCAPFGLTPSFIDEPGAKFEKVKLEADGQILPFLVELAKQRGLVIGADSDGNPQFWKSSTGFEPVAILKTEARPILSIEPTHDDRTLFSEVTGLAESKRGRPGNKYTEANTFLQGVIRPLSVTFGDTDPADVPNAVRATLGRSWGAAYSYNVGVGTIFDQSGRYLWDRNTTVRLKYPRAMIYTETDFIIRAVTFNVAPDDASATLNIALPGLFSGEIPESLPWDEPQLF